MPFVLVHGGCSTGAIWQLLTPLLDRRALAVDLPGRHDSRPYRTATFPRWAASVAAQMDEAGIERAIMVAHSMGGGTLAALARSHPERIAHAVFFSAVVPPDGDLFLHGLNARQQSYMHSAREQGLTSLPALDVPRHIQALHLPQPYVCGEALAPFFETVSLSGLAGVPVTFVKLLRDRSLDDEQQRRFILRLRAIGSCNVTKIDAGHLAMLSAPLESAACLNALT